MLFLDAAYIGLDPAAPGRPTRYIALDRNLQLVRNDSDDFEEVLSTLAGLESAVVAVAAPLGPNQGLMAQTPVRARYNLQPNGDTWRDWRVAEYELRRRNIRLYNTPSDPKAAPGWVRTGFEFFNRLRAMGFRAFHSGDKPHPRLMVEVQAHACYTVLLERIPFLKGTLEGRMQRQLKLYLEGIDIPNPMSVIEEITRHHVLSGHLLLDGLLETDELEALVAAYAAYLVGVRPDDVTQVGDPEEGLITLPAEALKDTYH
jgi:predicted nuclease with RNAse H fold